MQPLYIALDQLSSGATKTALFLVYYAVTGPSPYDTDTDIDTGASSPATSDVDVRSNWLA